MFIIDIRKLSDDETLLIEGEIGDDIFQLAAADSARFTGPLRYRAHASIVSGELLLRGDFEASFQLTCTRCMSSFEQAVILPEHALLTPLGSNSQIDLTEQIREDILLALPDHPRCDEAEGAGPCPATEEIPPEDVFDPLDEKDIGSAGPSEEWSALDKLKFDER